MSEVTCHDCYVNPDVMVAGVQLCDLHAAAESLLAAAKAIADVIFRNGDWADRGGWLADLETAIASATGGTS
jgi:hypothetical protein